MPREKSNAVNNKKQILDAWITVEQLSEGNIKKNDKQYRQFDLNNFEIQMNFTNFLNQQREYKKLSSEKFDKAGIVVYFGIFQFQEIVKILREKYGISATHEETTNSDKFTFALYFDKDLNIISDKFFFTMSGYIRYKAELPLDFQAAEDSIRDVVEKKFDDENFDNALLGICKQFQISLKNCRYAFVENLDNTDVNLHSFYIDDLQKAKIINTKNLSRYFSEFTGEYKNLDGNKNSQNFNPEIFEEILQPQFYPLGRFPGNPSYPLSFMQQVAVNLTLNDKNTIQSVNGPPGTGKTTLLKEIFADLVIQQAVEICNLSNKYIKATLTYKEPYKIAVLPTKISSKGIIVASSNNSAVQNIVNELPLIDTTIYEKENENGEKKKVTNFTEKLINVDYFREISNDSFENEKFWGTFSIEGGNSKNLGNLLNKVKAIVKLLSEEDYQSNPNVYAEFKSLYEKLIQKRQQIQKYADEIKPLNDLRRRSILFKNGYHREKSDRELQVRVQVEKLLAEKDDVIDGNLKIKSELVKLEMVYNDKKMEIRNFQDELSMLKIQKPNFIWFHKLINSTKIRRYFESLNSVTTNIKSLTNSTHSLRSHRVELTKTYEANERKILKIDGDIQGNKSEYQIWKMHQDSKLDEFKKKIDRIEDLKRSCDIKELDFSVSYEELQKSNFWFDDTFRIAQSELFIKALDVRKQFLYENRKHLEKVVWIWDDQPNYISKLNGKEIIQTAWDWINFTIPVISTTFASFGRMFKNLDADSLGNLFIDEAGQALPQASVGAIFRSRKVMAVGDPSQIKPVFNLDSNVLNLIARNYEVTEKFVSGGASTQSLVDATSQFGFKKIDDEWIGVPLWVHRRSNYPMFTISNEISYSGLMVQGKKEVEAQGKSAWLNKSGIASDKFVKEQGELLKEVISMRIQKNPELANEIYVISPFRNVAYNLAKILDKIEFTKRDENGKSTNVGSVHTFQGKEARIVFFVLGADYKSIGAAKWAVSKPNMMNVAATRAKEEFYIIGDKKLYGSLGSNIVNMTISIIDEYNTNNKETL